MDLTAKLGTGVSALVVAGLVALGAGAVFASVGASAAPSSAVDDAPALPASGDVEPASEPDLAAAYADGGVDYDAAAAAFNFPLPTGYVWPAGADRDVTPEAASDYVWYDWISAHADAARLGDESAATALESVSIPFVGAFASDVGGLIATDNYPVLLKMFPLPLGMKS